MHRSPAWWWHWAGSNPHRPHRYYYSSWRAQHETTQGLFNGSMGDYDDWSELGLLQYQCQCHPGSSQCVYNLHNELEMPRYCRSQSLSTTSLLVPLLCHSSVSASLIGQAFSPRAVITPLHLAWMLALSLLPPVLGFPRHIPVCSTPPGLGKDLFYHLLLFFPVYVTCRGREGSE